MDINDYDLYDGLYDDDDNAESSSQGYATSKPATVQQQPTANDATLNNLQQNVEASRAALNTASGRVNDAINGNVTGLKDIMAQYAPKETPEQTEARKRRERTASNILAWTNMLNGVANVVTASSGNTGRSVKPVDVVTPYEKGIMTAEAERRANDAAREKAREAYLDKALKRAQGEYNNAQNEYKANVGLFNNELNRRNQAGIAAAKNDLEREKMNAANQRAEQQNATRLKIAADGNAVRWAAVNATRDKLKLDKEKFEYKKLNGGGSGTGKNKETTLYYGSDGNKKIELDGKKWDANAKEFIFDIIQKMPDGAKWIQDEFGILGKNEFSELKSDEQTQFIQKFIHDKDRSHAVLKEIDKIAGKKNTEKISVWGTPTTEGGGNSWLVD